MLASEVGDGPNEAGKDAAAQNGATNKGLQLATLFLPL
jgi:hypothetical protein